MTATLLMEHLMTDPRYPELARLIRAATPADRRDQVDAAATDSLATMATVAELHGAEAIGAVNPGQVPGWLLLSVLDAFAGYLAGSAETCRHSPDPRSPRPVLAAAWRPGLVTCHPCAHLFHTVPGSDKDATCDGCGRRCAGVEQDDPIYPSMVQLGCLIFQYGTCSDCTTASPVSGQGRGKR